MKKEIYFCVDYQSIRNIAEEKDRQDMPCFIANTYKATEMGLKEGTRLIITNSMAHFSFDMITLGYDIYLCYKDKQVKIEPHMDLSGCGEPCKDLRFGHNIFKMFKAGLFNELLGIEL